MQRPPFTPPKRWTLKLALCLLAGAAITCAVAWACALWATTGEFTESSELEGPAAIRRAADYGFEKDPRAERTTLIQRECSGFGMSMREATLLQMPPAPAPDPHADSNILGPWPETIEWTRSGWPFLSLECRDLGNDNLGVIGGFVVPERWRPGVGRPLPVAIIPVGFTLNTALAAGVVLGVVEYFTIVRRRSRASRGRCRSCNYDRRGLASTTAACPECGVTP